MLDIKDIDYKPTIEEISSYIGTPLFNQFFQYMNHEYQPVCKIEYSKDTWARGWNVKLRKAGKALCVIYPKQDYFTVLVVVGRKEKDEVETLLPQLSAEMQELYEETREGNGQRWLMIDLTDENTLYQDVLRLICIRRNCK